jgi:hypothetical protein
MSEILTESFCERCGTRYTFESARPKVRLKGVKVLSRGLKNFVLSDDTTLDEAMAAARSETDREVTAHQLDAFHKTFNFCMSCRQYTCPNCWNEVEARCLSCVPHLGHEIMPAPFPGLATLAGTTVVVEPATNGANGHVHDEDETDAVAAVEPAEKATSQTAGLLRRFRPGQSLDDELAAFERQRTDAETREAEPEFVTEPAEAVAEAAEGAEPVAEAVLAETAPIEAVAAVEIEPQPAGVEAAATAVEPVAEAEPEPATQPAAPDVVEQPTWRITAPDAESPTVRPTTQTDSPIPAQASGSPLPPAEPEWPARPEWPAPQASIGLPFLGRPAQPQGGVDALWAASNQELVTTPPTPGRSSSGIQPCVSCGLSLSANARFCRRCGTLQGG